MQNFTYNLDVMMKMVDPVNGVKHPDKVKKIVDWYTESDIESMVRLVGYIEAPSRIVVMFQILTTGITVYDVLFEFEVTNQTKNRSLENLPVTGVYSNMPSFTYRHTYYFNKYGMIIKELAKKYDNKALILKPSKVGSNTQGYLGVEKSLYACAKFFTTLYTEDKINRIFSKPKNKKLKMSFGELHHLVGSQYEISNLRRLDTSKKHSRSSQNNAEDELVSVNSGTMSKEKYKSVKADKKSKKITEDIRDNANKTIGKKERTLQKEKLKVSKISKNHHRVTKKGKVIGKLPKKPRR